MMTSYKDLFDFSLSKASPVNSGCERFAAQPGAVNGESLEEVQQGIDTLRQTVRDTPLVGCIVPRQTWVDQTGSVARILVKPVTHSDLVRAIESLEQPVRRILLVDNDEEIINLYSRMILAGPGGERFTVQTATGGREALGCMRDWHPDLVLLDISMPDMDGFEVIAEKDQEPGDHAIPVMIVSAIDPHRQSAPKPAAGSNHGQRAAPGQAGRMRAGGCRSCCLSLTCYPVKRADKLARLTGFDRHMAATKRQRQLPGR